MRLTSQKGRAGLTLRQSGMVMRLEAKLGVEICEEVEDSKECGLGKDGFGMRWGWMEQVSGRRGLDLLAMGGS